MIKPLDISEILKHSVEKGVKDSMYKINEIIDFLNKGHTHNSNDIEPVRYKVYTTEPPKSSLEVGRECSHNQIKESCPYCGIVVDKNYFNRLKNAINILEDWTHKVMYASPKEFIEVMISNKENEALNTVIQLADKCKTSNGTGVDTLEKIS
jgi:hypothetical protein